VKLYGIGRTTGLNEPIIGRVLTEEAPAELRQDSVLVWKQLNQPSDTSGYLALLLPNVAPRWPSLSPLIHSAKSLDYLSDGDVIYVSPNGFVRTLYRKNSTSNFLLATDQCNSFCLMCSQPPRQVNDFDRIREHFRLIDLIDPETRELGITGGEPTLFKDDFLGLIDIAKTDYRIPRSTY
jgi:hypothetical protein